MAPSTVIVAKQLLGVCKTKKASMPRYDSLSPELTAQELIHRQFHNLISAAAPALQVIHTLGQ